MPRTCPLYAELISLHDNVIVASNVSFLTHDFTHHMLNRRVRPLDEHIEKSSSSEAYPPKLRPRSQTVSPELADFLREHFM